MVGHAAMPATASFIQLSIATVRQQTLQLSASEILQLSPTAQPDATCKLTKHCILRRGPRAPAHTRSLAIALQSLF